MRCFLRNEHAGGEPVRKQFPGNRGKGKIFSLVQSLAASFKQEFGTLYCRELLGLSPESLAAETARPGERTAAYYASRPCERCIAFCARCAAELEAKARRHENTQPPLQGNREL